MLEENRKTVYDHDFSTSSFLCKLVPIWYTYMSSQWRFFLWFMNLFQAISSVERSCRNYVSSDKTSSGEAICFYFKKHFEKWCNKVMCLFNGEKIWKCNSSLCAFLYFLFSPLCLARPFFTNFENFTFECILSASLKSCDVTLVIIRKIENYCTTLRLN